MRRGISRNRRRIHFPFTLIKEHWRKSKDTFAKRTYKRRFIFDNPVPYTALSHSPYWPNNETTLRVWHPGLCIKRKKRCDCSASLLPLLRSVLASRIHCLPHLRRWSVYGKVLPMRPKETRSRIVLMTRTRPSSLSLTSLKSRAVFRLL